MTSLLAAGAVAAGGVFGAGSGERPEQAPREALVIDAAAGREGRNLIDPRLREVDTEVRLPRSSTEALTNVRYFDAQGYRVVVAGPRASAAAEAAGVAAVHAPDLAGALAALGR